MSRKGKYIETTSIGLAKTSYVKVTQSCPTLSDPMDCSPWTSPGQNTGMGSLSLTSYGKTQKNFLPNPSHDCSPKAGIRDQL